MSEYDETGDYEEIVKRRLGPNPDGNERKKLLQTLHQTVRRERNTRKIDNLAHFDVPDLKDPSLSRPVLSPGDRKIVSALWKTDNWHRMCCAQARCGMSLNDLRNNAGDLLDRVEEYFRQFVRVKTRSGGQLVRPKVWDLLDSLRYQEDREAVLTRAHPKIGSQPMSQDQYELIHYLFRGVSAGVDPDYLGRTCQHCDRYHHIVRIVTAEKKAEYYLDKTHDV
jgi:hypothetical protein